MGAARTLAGSLAVLQAVESLPCLIFSCISLDLRVPNLSLSIVSSLSDLASQHYVDSSSFL